MKNVLHLADISGVDWMVRHGRSMTLAIAVKSAPEQLCVEDYSSTVMEAILANATADRVDPFNLFILFNQTMEGFAFQALSSPVFTLSD